MDHYFHAADLFCGAGGTSTGMVRAAKSRGIALDLIAVNHWARAVETHTLNHPWARHLCADLGSVEAHPSRLVPGGHLDLLVASPECTHHSIARGGRPCSDQSRASAYHVTHWLSLLDVDELLIENVREFADWGPLLKRGITYLGKYIRKGRPDPRKRGTIFKSYIEMIGSLGYPIIEWRVINAADFGAATTRQRLFVRASKRSRKIEWPEPSHAKEASEGLKRWKPAREIIDWNLKGKSVFNRKHPLHEKTMDRIEAGLKKFGGEAFIAVLRGTSAAQKGSWSASVEDPLKTISAGGIHAALVQPFIIPMEHSGSGALRSVEDPLPTITTAKGGAFGVCQPFLVPYHGGEKSKSERSHSVEDPIPTIDCENRFALCEPFLTKYYGTGSGARPVSDPLDTVTTRDRFALVQPQGIDILFRMLQPHELAAAMGFTGYSFSGNKTEQVRQIGNAVDVEVAEAICGSIFDSKFI